MIAPRVASLSVQIERYIDDHFPGWVACVLIDADGKRHAFTEKVPVLSSSDLRADSSYPQPGYIGCVIEHEWLDAAERKIYIYSVDCRSKEGVFSMRIVNARRRQQHRHACRHEFVDRALQADRRDLRLIASLNLGQF